MAPFSRERAGFGIIFAGSGMRREPRPAQSGQAPSALLKEKCRGVSWGMVAPVSGLVGWVENTRRGSGRISVKSGLVKAAAHVPWPRRRASSTESLRRPWAEDWRVRRSTTRSKEEEEESGSISTILFFLRILKNPSFLRRTGSAWVKGARRTRARPDPFFTSWSTICWGVKARSAFPVFGSCGVP